jgi:hypothetical protein
VRHRRTLLAATAAAIALTGALTAVLLWPHAEASALQDDGPHKLVAPKRVLRKYYLWTSIDRTRSLAQDHHKQLGVAGGTAMRLHYSTFDALGGHIPDGPTENVDLDGTYGTVADPEKAVDALFALLRAEDAHDGTIKLLGKPKERHPESFTNAVMKCQVERTLSLLGERMGDDPVCAWADYSTAAIVRFSSGDRGAMSVADAAQLATDLRREIRVPVRD